MIIQKVKADFIREASSAPSLFADLAKVELYIAESYRSRAFIELLQNADDAGAGSFVVRQVGKQLLVANDGRPFTQDDVIALCRSGASNKRRGSGTIGYRGIGFKSVAGIAQGIEVISDKCAFQFSKTITQQVLGINSDVPLIRVPHPITDAQITLSAQTLISEGMKTVFVLSGLEERLISEESESFDDSAMLFLKSVTHVAIELPNVHRILRKKVTPQSCGLSIEQIGDEEIHHDWLVLRSGSGNEQIAFALEGKKIVPALPTQSVIHAFMPTSEFSGGLFKMNGDFSTDPSRKSVNMDEESNNSFGACIKLLGDFLVHAVRDKCHLGVFGVFLLASPIEGRFRKLLREALLQQFDENHLSLNGISAPPNEVKLRPDWLSYADYESLCVDISHIPQSLLGAHPQFPDFLSWLGARIMSLEEVTNRVGKTSLTPLGCAQVFSRAARQYRYDLTRERIEQLSNTPFLPTVSGYKTPNQYRGEALEPSFSDFLGKQNESEDLRALGLRLQIKSEIFSIPETQSKAMPVLVVESVKNISHTLPLNTINTPSLFRNPPSIKAWRSAEQNAQAWLSALADVLTVKDVSQANVGYDLEVFKSNGDSMYVEVKSVSKFGDMFRLTNNEHATAYQLGDDYYLAIVVNSNETFAIRLIRNPINTLSLEKRCEQWSWYCENYTNHLIEYG